MSKKKEPQLYTSSIISAKRLGDETIEESIVHRKKVTQLPPENGTFNPVNLKNEFRRPNTSYATNSIFSGLVTPYDISHRRANHQSRLSKRKITKNIEQNQEPTFTNVNMPISDRHIAPERIEAAHLKEQLENSKKVSEESLPFEGDPFELKIARLEKTLEVHQNVLDAFTDQAKENAPERGLLLKRIADYYRGTAAELPKIKSQFDSDYLKLNDELDKAMGTLKELQKARDESQSMIDRHNKTIETLKQQIAEYTKRCQNAENQLRDAMNEKTSIGRSSQTNKQKLIEIEAQIEEKRVQKNKLNELIDTLSNDIANKTNELAHATNSLSNSEDELKRLREECANYTQILNDRTQLANKLKSIPIKTINSSNKSSIGIQVNRIPKRTNTTKPQAAPIGHSLITDQSQFIQIKSDMALTQQTLGTKNGSIEVNTFEDLQQIRQIILDNSHSFDYSIKSITMAYGGKFDIMHCSDDQARIYATWIMERIMNNSLKSIQFSNKSVQTEEVEEEFKNTLTSEDKELSLDFFKPKKKQEYHAPKRLLQFIKKSRLITLLDSDESNRQPKPIDWLIHSIRSIFDEKSVDDKTNQKAGIDILPMPEYVMIWAFRQWGRPDLIQKGVWDLFITSHFYMQRLLEVSMFTKFLDETWTLQQLTFFLQGRTWILERCVTFPEEHPDLQVYFSETYLTRSQVSDFLSFHFPNLYEELLQDLNGRARDCSDPSRGDQNTVACIPMYRLLELGVAELHDSLVRRLRKMLAFYRPTPRMTLKRFGVFVCKLVMNLDPSLIDSLYRSGNVPNSLRVDMDQEEFIKIFKSDKPICPIFPKETQYEPHELTSEEFAAYSPTYEMVLGRWKLFNDFVMRIIQTLEQENPEGGRTYVNEIRHCIFQLLDAKTTFDGLLFYQSYHRLLQSVINICMKLSLPTPELFTRQIEDLITLISQKYQKVLDANEITN